LISARRRFGKKFFEVEEETPAGKRRLIGKFGKTERTQTLHETLHLLRNNGFRPPSMFVVPEPIAHFAEKGFLLQEKATGVQASDLMRKTTSGPSLVASCAAARAAMWLAALHCCGVRAPSAASSREALSEWASGLAAAVPAETRRIDVIAEAIGRGLAQPPAQTVPCHGDFHPMNIFIAGDEITAIDLDKFSEREPESDIGYFLSQTAAFDFFENASFGFSAGARRAFVESYESHAGRRISRSRAAMYMAMAFLKNLHFDLVLLESGRTERVDAWLAATEAAIFHQDLQLES
jgi:aminoglycoside phosphotransferase (APT) family kinase protein